MRQQRITISAKMITVTGLLFSTNKNRNIRNLMLEFFFLNIKAVTEILTRDIFFLTDFWFGAMVQSSLLPKCVLLFPDRDVESASTMKKVHAWICALLSTDRDLASVIPDKKRTSVIFVNCW